MTYASDTFNGDGSTTEFTLTFDYIQRDHVNVSRIDKTTKVVTTLSVVTSGQPTGDQYIWETDTKIKVGTAPTATEDLLIVRDTPEDEQIVDWKDGSYIVAEDLNTSDKQWLYNIQELEDQINRTDGSVSGPAVKEVLGTAPITVDSTNPQKPIIGSDAVTKVTGTAPVKVDASKPQEPDVEVDVINKADAEKDPTSPSWDTDDKLASPAAIDRIYKQIVGDGAGFPGSGNKGKLGQIRIDNTGATPEVYYWDASNTAWVEVKVKGDAGPQGPAGPPPGLQDPATSVSNVALKSDGEPGDATVSIDQDGDKDLKFNFGIPVGKTGATGSQGPSADPVIISQDDEPTFAEDTIWFNTRTGKAYFGYKDPNDDEYWISLSGADGVNGGTATISDTAPTGAGNGQIWFDSKRGKAYVYWLEKTVWVQM